MPMRKTRRPRYRKRKAGRKARLYRKMPAIATAGRGQTARIVETLECADLTVKSSYENVFSLSQFPRACALAGNFQFYRATKVIWSYEPCYNTFQSGNVATSKPYLYVLMNRTQNSQNAPQLNQLQACGARPVALVSTKKVVYKPNWCSAGLTAVIPGPTPGDRNYLQQGLRAQYGWLASGGRTFSIQTGNPAGSVNSANPPAISFYSINPTNQSLDNTTTTLANSVNNTVYNGHTTYIDQEYQGAEAQVIARLTCTVHWEFKGAVFNNLIGPQSQTPAGNP